MDQENLSLSQQIVSGIRLAIKKLYEERAKYNEDVVVFKDGKMQFVNARQYLREIKNEKRKMARLNNHKRKTRHRFSNL